MYNDMQWDNTKNTICWQWVAADRCGRKELEKKYSWLQEHMKQKIGATYYTIKGGDDIRGADPCP